jgi:AcrR family transcriptional regulator
VERAEEGLRARKKRAARDGIAAAARRLFAERGYDAVTVVEIAAAADVSEKTVFNHFATKEDLAFAGRADALRELVGAIRERPEGTSVLDVFRAATAATLDGDLDEDLATAVRGSRALQERLAAGWEDEAAALAAAIGDDLVAAVAARALSWTHRAILLQALVDGSERSGLRAAADRAYDQLARGLADIGR